MPPRFAKRIDSNQQEIVKQLRSIPGVSVELDHDDILVGRNGKTFWFEIKSKEAVSKRKGTVRGSEVKKSQEKIKVTFTGHYQIVWSLSQILEAIGVIRNDKK